MGAFYNEIEPYAAAWMRELQSRGHVAAGLVDERSIRDLQPADLSGFTQCHFFAGIAGWSRALRLAGWPDDVSVWTGSCPCQPFSQAGSRKGTADERHLWPEWFRLIRECRPAVIFGEQVASPDGLTWFDAVSSDLEDAGYAVGAADLCAAGVGAPHLRQRLWFVAVACDERRERLGVHLLAGQSRSSGTQAAGRGATGAAVEHAAGLGSERGPGGGWTPRSGVELASAARGLGDAGVDGDRQHARELQGHEGQHEIGGTDGDHAPLDDASRGAIGSVLLGESSARVGSSWAECDWIPCTDGKSRPVEPGSFPLAHGVPDELGRSIATLGGMARRNRRGRLHAYGNAIVPEVAATFICASVEAITGRPWS